MKLVNYSMEEIDLGGKIARIKESRSGHINYLINEGVRYEIGVNSRGRFYGCEVCWTCAHFDIKSSICSFSWKNALEKVSRVMSEEKERLKIYYIPVKIVKPAWFRCAWWEDRGV